MKRRAWWLLAAVAVLCAATPRVPRSTLAGLERNFDQRLESFDINDPLYVLGATRGVYLEGYGAVFTSEISLVPPLTITPFRPNVSKEDIAKLRLRKLARLPHIKKLMRDMLVHSGNTLVTMPPQEQVVVGVVLSNLPWEDTTGLPPQIIMQAPRRVLSEFESGQISSNALDAAIRVQEY